MIQKYFGGTLSAPERRSNSPLRALMAAGGFVQPLVTTFHHVL